ncbi:hypothetical protein Tco_0626558 [Tanacetum coccineum]|uniref:Uncharacterized protein n=1 Tax=Tanacetum coccineum TaxID=301880 RepID=A0ABQ4WK00_9ASTR
MAFVSSSNNNTSSTNEAVNTAHGVSTASTQVNAANSTNIDNLSDVVICAFFASQPNSPQLIHEDLQQIHLDDMEEMDLRWQMAMLTMRARRAPRNQDKLDLGKLRRSVSVENILFTALVSCDGLVAFHKWNLQDPGVIDTYTDSDYAGASLDRKSTTGGCQFLGCRLISWQCKKQTVVANSTTEAEYVAASSCCGQVLWIQNQLLDYGYNFMHTKIFIDNNRKAKKSVKLMMEKLFGMELELMLFWSTAMAKTINREAQLHARVDGKKIIITKSSIRRDLRLEDVEDVNCLPNSTIFEQLAMMGMIRNLDNLSGKFLMYPRFVQVFLDQQLDGVPTHKRRYIAPSHTKKIFGNMRRVGKGFSGRITPLFPTIGGTKQSTIRERKPKRKDTQVPQPSDPIENVADEAVHKELGDSLVRAATIASSLEVEQDSGNITKTQSKATPNESSSQELIRVVSPSAKNMRILLLKTRVLDLDEIKDHLQWSENATSRGDLLRISLVNDADKEMFDMDALDGEEVFVEEVNEKVNIVEEVVEVINIAKLIIDAAQVSVASDTVSTASAAITVSAATTTADDLTLAQALKDLKISKPNVKGIVIQELEPVKPLKKKDQIRLDEEAALKLQAEFDEEERLAREKAKKEQEDNIALIETWDDIQVKIDADHQLAERMQAKKQERVI